MSLQGGSSVNIETFREVVFSGARVSVDEVVMARAQASFDFLKGFAEGKIIYGVNTGLGPMAQYVLQSSDTRALQLNLIRSHAAGSGARFPDVLSRATLFARLCSLAQGYSGVHPSLLQQLAGFLNQGICPFIHVHGGVGASGDLVQLAHMALGLLGEGKVTHRGVEKGSAEVLAETGLEPLQIHMREGLALMNGTSAMTGIGLCNVILARRLNDWCVLLSAILCELVGSYNDHFSAPLHNAKPHPGQQQVAAEMRRWLDGSGRIHDRHEEGYQKMDFDHLVPGKALEQKVQEYYSIRCVPQVLGPLLDTLNKCEQVLLTELNSCNDNPIVDIETRRVYHGGNFHGEYVAQEMDHLKVCVTKLSMLAERQLNFLLNPHLNRQFPPFLNMGKLGLNFGLQGLQFTATSTTAENQTLAFPMSVHSIPSNNDNQDIVSMGTNAALLTQRVIENSYTVTAALAIAVVQAVAIAGCEAELAAGTREYLQKLRAQHTPAVDDLPLADTLEKMRKYLLEAEPQGTL